jgi:hypothetical protein
MPWHISVQKNAVGIFFGDARNQGLSNAWVCRRYIARVRKSHVPVSNDGHRAMQISIGHFKRRPSVYCRVRVR